MATQEFLNVLDPQYTRYIHLRADIEGHLAEKYGTEVNFKVSHDHDRWSFYTPEKLTKKQIKEMTKEILAKREQAQKEDDSAGAGMGTG